MGNQGFVDYVLFVGFKFIVVVEVKCNNIDVFVRFNELYCYSKCFDNGFLWEILFEYYLLDEVYEVVLEYEISWQDISGK